MKITASLAAELLQFAKAAAPREAAGFLYGPNQVLVRLIPLTNTSLESLSFRLDQNEMAEVLTAQGRPSALFHSHPTDIPHPSLSDIDGAAHWPGLAHIILSLSPPAMKCWLIHDGQAIFEPLETVADSAN